MHQVATGLNRCEDKGAQPITGQKTASVTSTNKCPGVGRASLPFGVPAMKGNYLAVECIPGVVGARDLWAGL
ncbi:hypothetical protein [Endozoicomonas sp. ALC013]|uniref:hypothetical protein n=1 Tax=Endozoicomonas sp. ALC013 TaxID=3403076 RepID=UPI003BB68EB1